MPRFARAFAVALILGLTATACTIEPSELEETEEQYLERVEGVFRPLRETTAEFTRLYQDTDDRDEFRDGLKEVRAAAAMVDVFRQLDGITAPPRFFPDQRRVMRAIAEMVPISRTAEQLADREEMVQSSTRHAHVSVLYQRTLLEHTSRFCLVAARSASERDLCDPLRILPGAAYGDRLHDVLSDASAEFTPRAFSFVAQVFTRDEVADYLQSIGPSLVEAVREARDSIRQLVPPDEFAADHRVIEEYFDEITRISQEIAEAARENPTRLQRLFPESRQVVNRARARLSEDIRPAVAVWFFPTAEDES